MSEEYALIKLQAATELNRLINGYQQTQVIHVAAVLGLADHLTEGPLSCEKLAKLAGANPRALYRLMRALAAMGVFFEHPDSCFSLTPMGECLRSDADPSLRPWATFIAQPHRWQTWGHLLQAVKTGANAFQEVLGVDSWTYRQQNPEQNAIFNAAMTANSERINPAIITAYDFSRHIRIADLGGGQGSLLAAILKIHSGVQGVLFDLPHVVESSHLFLQEAGVSDRCSAVAGNLFDSVPEECDLHLMKFILHDWDDEHCRRILQNCRRAIPSHGTLLIVEYLIDPPNLGPAVKLSDLNMLLGPGGQERTREEFGNLLHHAGFELVNVLPTSAPVTLIVARPT